MVAQSPTFDPALDDAESEAAYELVLDCTRGARSLMSEYAVKEGAKGKLETIRPRWDDERDNIS